MDAFSVLDLIANDNFIVVNKTMIKLFGMEGAVLFGELAAEYNYHQKRNDLTDDGFFYATVERIQENTGLSDYQQRSVLENLQGKGVIEMKRMGMPAKRYIRVLEDGLSVQFSKNLRTSSKKTKEHDLKKLEMSYKNREIRIDNNNSLSFSLSSFPESNQQDNPASDGFDQFWEAYDKKVGRQEAERLWKRLSERDKEKIRLSVPLYVQSTPEQRFRKNPATYLRQRSWEDEIINRNIPHQKGDFADGRHLADASEFTRNDEF